jgi:BirA family transcriptional regulator, biotin operon repressor / biotin---[acetyl-CoA-carboxylase] ligase
MTQPLEIWNLDTRRLGRSVQFFSQLNSTNNYAASLADDPANDGVAVLADEQTAGRGQHGRTWTAAPRASVLLSLLLFPPPALRRPAILTAWAAVSVCETVRRVIGLEAQIKWPNDVLLKGRKVCGILIEQGRGTVAGIGLNVRQTAEDFAAADLPFATSLGQHTSVALDTRAVASTLLDVLDEGYARLCDGNLTTLEAQWKGHLGLLGKDVRVECLDGEQRGRLLEIAFEGLVLRQPSGGEIVLPPECVLHLYAV